LSFLSFTLEGEITGKIQSSFELDDGAPLVGEVGLVAALSQPFDFMNAILILSVFVTLALIGARL
jgi:hypothetical protein